MKRTITLFILCFVVLFDCFAQEKRHSRFCEDEAQSVIGVSIGGYGKVIARHIIYSAEETPEFFEARFKARHDISLKVTHLVARVSLRAGVAIDGSVKATILDRAEEELLPLLKPEIVCSSCGDDHVPDANGRTTMDIRYSCRVAMQQPIEPIVKWFLSLVKQDQRQEMQQIINEELKYINN